MDQVTKRLLGLPADKLRVLGRELGKRRNDRAGGPNRRSDPGQNVFALSFAQQRLWFLDQLAPGNPAYNWPFAMRFSAALDPHLMRLTLNELVKRHEILRTTYPVIDDAPVQFISPPGDVPLRVTDLRECGKKDLEAEATRIINEDARMGFDLANGPLHRFQLLRLGTAEWVFAGTMHHSIVDAWSGKVMTGDIIAISRALADRRSPDLPDLPIQYADYAVWQREWLTGKVLDDLLSYWRRQLADVPLVELPTDRPRPRLSRFRGMTETVSIPKPLTASLRTLSTQAGATLFMTLLAAYGTLLSRFTGRTDITVAVPIAGRNRLQLESLIGFFVNTLIMRLDLSGNPSFRELLGRVQKVCLDAYAHQDMPFERLVEDLQPERDLSRNPLAQFIFQLEDIPQVAATASASLIELDVDAGTAIFDVHVHLYESRNAAAGERPDGIWGTVRYNADIFAPTTIRRLFEHYRSLLAAVAATPDLPILELPLTPERDAPVPAPIPQAALRGEETVVEIFARVAAATPDRPAIVCGDTALTYAELNQRANRLARHLVGRGIGREALVALCFDRSVTMVIGLLAVLKAGGAYLPLDPSLPKARFHLLLADSRCRMLLTQQTIASGLDAPAAVETICIDARGTPIARASADEPGVTVHPEQLAYVIYTSGSTGHPKGVAIEHRQLLSYVSAISERLDLSAGMTFALASTFAADLGYTSLYPSLCHGGTLHILTADETNDAQQFRSHLRRNRIDCLKITPSHFAALMADGPDADLLPERRLVFGGEPLHADWVRQLTGLKPSTRIFNHYGPAECTVGALTYEIKGDVTWTNGGTVPVGFPLANTEAYVLDPSLKPQPMLAPGELYLGGAGVGRGYLHRADLTRERFIIDPFAAKSTAKSAANSGARMYRTGDRARRLHDGSIEYLGRCDDQVKVRGYRVELGEVESALRRHPMVDNAVVLARQQAGDCFLSAVVAPKRQDSTSGKIRGRERISEWRAIYDNLYGSAATGTDETFNTVGWNDSYTGLPLSAEEMSEAVDRTVGRILSLRPRRVLEMGCGTGLLLYRVAPHCESYVATDFSVSAVNHVRQHVRHMNLPQITVLHRPADDLSGFAAESFDTIVLNSVVQYFPDIDFLADLLAAAAGLVAPGGSIFVGDVRSLPHLRLFAASVEMTRASISLPPDKLLRRIQKRVAQEEECIIAPEFFAALPRRIPAITHVDVQLKPGRYSNELTKFRYDALLRIQGPAGGAAEFQTLHWQRDALGVADLSRLLEDSRPRLLGVADIPNRRLVAEQAAVAVLNGAGHDNRLDRAKSVLRESRHSGIDPEDLCLLGAAHGYAVSVTWAASGDLARFDALFGKDAAAMAAKTRFDPSRCPAPERASEPPWRSYANDPLRGVFARDLGRQLRHSLEAELPDYMVPATWSVVEHFPLTANGKIDREALGLAERQDTSAAATFVPPRDSVELRLARIWEDVLDCHPIGIRDDFFELGGHSLVAVRLMARISKAFGVNLPLATLFERRCVEQLAVLLRRGIAPENQSPLVLLRGTGSAPPLFLVHPAGGEVMCYYELVLNLRPGRPVYGLEFRGIDAPRDSLVAVEQIATHYISAIRAARPRGPYLLGGWSMGGMIAFEMAAQLRRQGDAVPLVIVFDMRAPGGEPEVAAAAATPAHGTLLTLARKIEILTGQSLDVAEGELASLTAPQQMALVAARLQSRGLIAADVDASSLGNLLAVYESNLRSIQAYRPPPAAVPILLIRGSSVFPDLVREHPDVYADPALGWRSLTHDRVIIREVPGNHMSMIRTPNASALAEVVDGCLSEIEAVR